jgi:DNA-binding MarR family transcriptional regulator
MQTDEFKNLILEYTRKIGESMNCVFSPAIENHGLTKMQIRILLELNQCGFHTIGSLADSTCVAGANISAMCKRLENQGLVKRVRNREDERVVKVILTDQGSDIVLEVERMLNERISKYLVNETEANLEDIVTGLKKLNELLQKIGN